MKPQISNLIKTVSIIAITGALILEGGNLYLQLQDKSLPNSLNPVLWVATIALIVHGIQGAIAAFQASSQGKNPFTYGIYTFFVGTIALKELSNN